MPTLVLEPADGGVDVLVLGNDQVLHVARLGDELLARRAALLQEVTASEAAVSTVVVRNTQIPAEDPRRLLAALDALHALDFAAVVRPLLDRLPAGAGLVLHEISTTVPRFSARSALLWGVRAGRLSRDRFLELPTLALWRARANRALRAMDALPPVRRGAVHVVACPPEQWIERRIRSLSADDAAALVDRLGAAAGPQLEAVRAGRRLEAALRRAAEAAGARLLCPATSADLLDTLSTASGALFLVCHHPAEGLALDDRAVSIEEVFAALSARNRLHSAFLGVCRPQGAQALDPVFQEAGTPVVASMGAVAYYRHAIEVATALLRQLVDDERPLPDLLARAHLELAAPAEALAR